MNGLEFDVVRYYLEDGKPIEERITFRDADSDDERARPLPIEVLVLVGADGIDKPWVWTAAVNPGFATPEAIIVGEQTTTDLSGQRVRSAQWAFPADSDYWDVLKLPARPGVVYVHRGTYDKAVENRTADSATKMLASKNVRVTKRQGQWDLQRRIHQAANLRFEESLKLIGPRPE